MLTLTDNAAAVVRTLTQQIAGETGGLRFSRQPGMDETLTIRAAAAPEPGDQVVEQDGARVFLTEEAAAALDDQILDAVVDAGGSVHFSVAPQPPSA
jgi:iron-sulfur cluster assembly protein